jgi:hypothetical protein
MNGDTRLGEAAQIVARQEFGRAEGAAWRSGYGPPWL